MRLIATAAFGVEAAVKREIAHMGYPVRRVENGRIFFDGDDRALAAANLRLRTADRVLFIAGEFMAATFEELFNGVSSIIWDDILPEDAKINVTAKSLKSKLFAVPDIQSITKKAIIERLKRKYTTDWFAESGAAYSIEAAILEDNVIITIDTSGAGLHKRGYRIEAGIAPIKETLAAAMLSTSYWKPGRPLFDPFCGSGTFLIEAATAQLSMAAGLRRAFASEKWGFIDKAAWRKERERAFSGAKQPTEADKIFFGFDNDERILKTARQNAEAAGVGEIISFTLADINDCFSKPEGAIIITNPPYGSRLGDINETRKTYSQLRRLAGADPLYVITGDIEFEKIFGKKADSRRKLFNGGTEAAFLQYHGVKVINML